MLVCDGVNMERLLIISNNVLSETTNNGKTIYSFFDTVPKEQIRQLYFSGEKPCIEGIRFFRISDSDVIKGRLFPSRRGLAITPHKGESEEQIVRGKIPRNTLTCLIREALWIGAWKSKALLQWLDEYKPTTVFYHAGDCVFAHRVFRFIVKRYSPRVTVYLTDDYVMPRKKEDLLSKIRRIIIHRSLKKVISASDVVFTVSDNMRKAYRELYKKDSVVIVNMTESMLSENYLSDSKDINIIYAGSLYFGRGRLIGEVADAIEKYNNVSGTERKVNLNIYTNFKVTGGSLKESKYVHIKGKLNKEQLVAEYNRSDIMLFVESFDAENIEKTKYSLSTKIPEYMSLHKPIFAVGPDEVASMQYLRDVAACVNKSEDIYPALVKLVESDEYQKELSDAALDKYQTKHNKQLLQGMVIKQVFNNELLKD